MPRGARPLDLIRCLAGTKIPLTQRSLSQKTGISKSAMSRLLKQLVEEGFVEVIPVGAYKRFRLSASIALGTLSQDQIAALIFTSQALAPLQGSRLATGLNALVAPLSRAGGAQAMVRLAPPSPLIDPAIFNTVLESCEKKHRLRCLYQGNKDEQPRWREVDPLLFYSDGDQPYLEVFDLEVRAFRTFKLIRMTGAERMEQPAAHYPTFNPAQAKRHARRVWDAPLVEVVVRLAPEKARFASEWPLNRDGQTEEPQPDGSVHVKARLTGTEEALKWVLSWGAGARVLAPAQLQEAHRRELEGALAGYQAP